MALNRAYRGHPAAVHTDAPGRRELTFITITITITVIVIGITITHITLNNEVSKISSERKAHET